jgi:hypothetical protein
VTAVLPLKADIAKPIWHGSFVPTPVIRLSSPNGGNADKAAVHTHRRDRPLGIVAELAKMAMESGVGAN